MPTTIRKVGSMAVGSCSGCRNSPIRLMVNTTLSTTTISGSTTPLMRRNNSISNRAMVATTQAENTRMSRSMLWRSRLVTTGEPAT